ncbi:hypothetical protein HOLleu_13191 [Holothuria leucospilota]|uniref:Transmembrane protein 208 n=1 Tax=Holothuria leucospilota TaxID=206669 RepID=A0A9Q1CBD2_HOLLE|nr:hypothetical protein HOLleu_13191 [Holothuria leucospilota]
MPAKPKGKVGTKGQKQIAEENKSTMQFYSLIMAAATGVYFLIRIFWLLESCTWWTWFVVAFTCLLYVGAYQVLSLMGKAKYTEAGTLLDAGMDLNAESGTAEHIKDIIILTAVVQTLSLISEYFWLLWLLIPGRAFYLLWTNILSPWIFAEPPEIDEKKQRKMERRANRRF